MSNYQKPNGVNMKKILAVLLVLVTSANFMFAQSTTPGIDKTQKHQRVKIHQGIKSGEITKREARALNNQQVRIQHEKKLAKSDGVITVKERKHIRHQQRKAGKNIAMLKHNKFNRN